MTINQLFLKKPSKKLIEKLLSIFGYNIDIDNDILDENFKFNKEKLLTENVLDKFLLIKDELQSNYIKCKQDTYFNDLNIKKIITLLRQHLKLLDYKLVSEIKYYNNQKIINYKIINLKKDNNEKKNCIITFD